MKKYLLYICVATLLISCNKVEVPPIMESGTMSFAAQLSNSEDDWSAHSRGAVTTSGTITDFSAFCFRTGSFKWADVGLSTAPNKIFNQLVERNGNAWVYTPGVKWEAGDVSHFSFFGYSPYPTGAYDLVSNPTGNNIELVSSNATAGAPVISFAPLADLSSQIDLLVAKPVLDTRPVDYVAMNFTHALTQVRFKGWTDQPKTEITSIKIKGVVGKASLNIGGIEWVAGSETADYHYDFSALEVSTDKASMTDLSPGTNTFMLLPQDMTANTTAVVEFTYTIDEVPLVKEYVLKENWKRNQAMVYTVNLTEADQPLDITVEVTPWVIGVGGVGDADVDIVLEEGSFIPNEVLLAAGWPADILPIEGGLQVAMIGNVLPGGTPAAKDPTMKLKTENTPTTGVEVAPSFVNAKFGMGKISTDAMTIPSQIDLHPAAKACRAMGPEWYLPSIVELVLINNNKSLLGAAYTLSADYYWSATEQVASTAYLINTQSNIATTGKTSAQGVRCVKGTPPRAQIDVTPTLQADIPIDGGTYTVQLTSNYAWTASSTVSGVTVTPSSGASGTTEVEITVPANATSSEISCPVVFTTTGSGETATTTWAGTQLAPPLFIEINGYKWATGNLVADGENGAKIGTPHNQGLFFQFGSLIGWSGGATGDGTGVGEPALALNVKPAGYSASTDYATCGYYSLGGDGSGLPAADVATTGIGDPCRYYLGSPWRTPTVAEFTSVASANASWQISPAGMNFNDNSTKLFILASGFRGNSDGAITGVGVSGYYWSESVVNADTGYGLLFESDGAYPNDTHYRRSGMPVRCVTPPPAPAISVTTTTQADIPVEGGTYTVQLTSNYAWSMNALPSGVTVTPSSGAAGITTVEITIAANTTTSEISYPLVFTATGGGTTANTTWTGTQLAPPAPAISVTTTTQADIPTAGYTYTVQLTSNYAWSMNALPSGVTVTPSSGVAGITTVEITIPVNTTTSAVSYPLVFTATGGGTTATTTWTGTQLEVLPIEAYGILWATGNLVADGANGARIGAPTDCGLYFQFGSLIGWSGGTSGSGEGAPSAVTKSLLEVKPKAYSGMTTFYACGYYAGAAGSELPTTDDAAQGIGDPCRFYLGGSWRLPKLLEFQALCNGYAGGYNSFDLANVAWNNTSPKGMTFNNSSSSNQVYIPASGIRESLTAASYLNVDKNASLWTSETHSTNATSGMYMNLGSNFVLPLKTFINRTNGLSVRCVREI